MKHILTYVFLVIVGFFGCKKDNTPLTENHASFLRVMQVNHDYQARDVVEFPDGSVLISSVRFLVSNSNTELEFASILAKYALNGDLLWQIELPKIVNALWRCKLLANGNVIVLGQNVSGSSKEYGAIIVNPDGEVIAKNAYYNPLSFTYLGGFNGASCVELPNGNIVLAMPTSANQNDLHVVRLLVIDQNLNEVADYSYTKDSVILRRPVTQVNIALDNNGDLLIHGRDGGFSNDTTPYFAFTLKVETNNYTPLFQQLFFTSRIKRPNKFVPSNIAVSNLGELVWAASGPLPSLKNAVSLFGLEVARWGPSVFLWKTDGDDSHTVRKEITGFPKNGFVSKIKKCKSGGYIMLGTCNLDTDVLITSNYKIMLIKVSESLEVEWMAFPKTNSQSVGADVVEVSTGYLVSATHLSLGEISQPILFKTDKNGIIN